MQKMTSNNLISLYAKKTTIFNCYKIKRKQIKNTIENLIDLRKIKNLPITRSQKSYEKELKSHILMYKLHLFRKHTKDCDLEEHIKKWKNIFYYMIGW